jgi:hypothetical protein
MRWRLPSKKFRQRIEARRAAMAHRSSSSRGRPTVAGTAMSKASDKAIDAIGALAESIRL